MNPIQLQKPSGESVKLWLCGECNLLCSRPHLAEKCCQPCQCGKESWNRFQGKCRQCFRDEQYQRQQDRLDNAKVVEWDGEMMLYSEDIEGGRDGWFSDLDSVSEAIFEWWSDFPDWEPPEYVFASTKLIRKLDLDWALERMVEDTYEDADVPASAVVELQKHVDAFNEKHAITYFDVDYNGKVRVKLPERPNA